MTSFTLTYQRDSDVVKAARVIVAFRDIATLTDNRQIFDAVCEYSKGLWLAGNEIQKDVLAGSSPVNEVIFCTHEGAGSEFRTYHQVASINSGRLPLSQFLQAACFWKARNLVWSSYRVHCKKYDRSIGDAMLVDLAWTLWLQTLGITLPYRRHHL